MPVRAQWQGTGLLRVAVFIHKQGTLCAQRFFGDCLALSDKKIGGGGRTQSTSNCEKLVGMCALIKYLRPYPVFLFYFLYLLTLRLIYAHLVIKVTCGVPQGSVPGPKLFMWYDICNVSKLFNIYIFVDDTNLFSSGSDLEQLPTTEESELKILKQWFCINKLLLNLNKTKVITFWNLLKTNFWQRL